MIQKKFGQILVLKEVSTDKPGKHYVCQCECGVIKVWRGTSLRNGAITRCRNCASKAHSKSFDDPTMVGRFFGRLVILSAEGSDKRGKLFKAQCICGHNQIYPGSRLRCGRANACDACARKKRFNTLDESPAIGRKFGKLFVLKALESGISGKTRFECMCDCGRILAIYENNLKRNKSTQCQSCSAKIKARRFIDLTMIGRKFGRLTVIRAAGSNGRLKIYECLCECGNTSVVTGGNLKTGNSTQCLKCVRPGHTLHPSYESWIGMLKRCNNPNRKSYKDYGGRGIKVCERWESSFENFCADMGERPKDMHLDRIDVDGNYEPNNCRWINRIENINNRRCSAKNSDKYILIRKDRLCLSCQSGETPINNSFSELEKLYSIGNQASDKIDLRHASIKGRYEPGLRDTPIYRAWAGMRNRCYYPKNKRYKHYGGRGIKVCKRWNDFLLFKADMGERPDGIHLDRIDPDGNYEPGNCRWVTSQENHANQRNAKKHAGLYIYIRKDKFCKKCAENFLVKVNL